MSDVSSVLDCLLQAGGFHVYLFTSENRSEGHEELAQEHGTRWAGMVLPRTKHQKVFAAVTSIQKKSIGSAPSRTRPLQVPGSGRAAGLCPGQPALHPGAVRGAPGANPTRREWRLHEGGQGLPLGAEGQWGGPTVAAPLPMRHQPDPYWAKQTAKWFLILNFLRIFVFMNELRVCSATAREGFGSEGSDDSSWQQWCEQTGQLISVLGCQQHGVLWSPWAWGGRRGTPQPSLHPAWPVLRLLAGAGPSCLLECPVGNSTASVAAPGARKVPRVGGWWWELWQRARSLRARRSPAQPVNEFLFAQLSAALQEAMHSLWPF